VLLVEDNPVNQTVIEAMLRSLGFTVSVATDGAQAVRSAESLISKRS
jgi:CheY-like chemotaxis protein